jgi:putative PEP-CTERM system histidine kinase
MPEEFSFYSYGLAATAFAVLTCLVLIAGRQRTSDTTMGIATLATTLWAISIAAPSPISDYPFRLIHLTELFRNASWCLFLQIILSQQLGNSSHFLAGRNWMPWYLAGVMTVLAILLLPQLVFESSPWDRETLNKYNLISVAWVGVAGYCLYLLELVYRTSEASERGSMRFFCAGLGIMFIFDLVMYSKSLLLAQPDSALFQARGAVNAMCAVFLTISVAKPGVINRGHGVRVSRHIIFQSVVLLAVGFYLISVAIAGYFVRNFGGNWSAALQIVFLLASCFALLALVFSQRTRSRLRVWISKHFFSYKYDYRVEWLQFSQALAEGDENLPEVAIRAVANLIESPGGLLVIQDKENTNLELHSFNMPIGQEPDDLADLRKWLLDTEWVIDLEEWRRRPDLYRNLPIPDSIKAMQDAGLVIPLMFQQELQSILILRKPTVYSEIDWEDRDLLKTAGRQAATHIAQFYSNKLLVESRQFEAFNRLSAYVIHDLKNILAQQSLLVANARKHRHNQEFVEDMITTIEHSVERMTLLMEQMRSGNRGLQSDEINLVELLKEAVNARSGYNPHPTLIERNDSVILIADKERLRTVFTHIIQNAQEATPDEGHVTVSFEKSASNVVVSITDNGVGMSEDFVQNRLFKPFDSTKGLTGIGIGAFESLEFIKSLGGNIIVDSAPGDGTTFRVVIPCLPSTGTGTGG